MLAVNSIIGNIFQSRSLEEKHRVLDASGMCERLKVSRLESQRVRLRKKTDKGTDIGLMLPREESLHHGDVLLLSPQQIIIVEQIPEKVISIALKDDIKKIELPVKIGHIIGNRHKPISFDSKGRILFPIEADAEVDIFINLMYDIIDQIELKIEERIFESQTADGGGGSYEKH